MPKTKTIDGKEMKTQLQRVHETSPQHVVGQTRENVEGAMSHGLIQDGWTITFCDEKDEDAYCLATVKKGKLVVLYKTYESLGAPLPEDWSPE